MADPPPPTPAPTPAAPSAPPPPSARTLPPKIVKPTNPFVYLGIPQFVLDWRPSVPGPKMGAFLTVSLSLTGLYIYDRQETARIQKEYCDKVRWMSEQNLDTHDRARKIRVYGARVPEDGELERGAKWFKRYMRPVLVASGTDYALKVGTNPGGLGRTLVHEIRARRITQAAHDTPNSGVLLSNSAQANVNAVLAEKELDDEKKEGEGAIVLLGRGALKEYLWALRKGYGSSIDLRDEAKLEGLGLGANERRKDGRWEREEELVSRELEKEDSAAPEGGPFDERATSNPEGLDSVASSIDDADSAPTSSSPVSFLAPGYSSFRPVGTSAPPPSSASPPTPEEPALILPPSPIPPQPPLLLVPFSHPFGIPTWPSKLAHFWNHRSDARLGGEYALALLASQSRPFAPPTERDSEGRLVGILDEDVVQTVRTGGMHELTMAEHVPTGSADLDFLAAKDDDAKVMKKTYRTLPKSHEFARRTYYTSELPASLKIARELARGEREATSAEEKYPPKLESELRKERLDKEVRWRRELEGWAVQRAGSGVAWEEDWSEEGKLKVLELPGQREKEEVELRRQGWEDMKRRRDEEREEQWKQESKLRAVEGDDE